MKKTLTVPTYLDDIEGKPLGEQLKLANAQLDALKLVDVDSLSDKGKRDLYLVWHSTAVLRTAVINAMTNILNHFSLN